MDHERLFSLATNISTYTELKAAGQNTAITQSIDRAQMCIVLGFGFHEQNLQILNGSTPSYGRRVLATVLGMDAENFDTMKIRLAHAFRCDRTENVQLLSRPAHNLMTGMRPTLLSAL